MSDVTYSRRIDHAVFVPHTQRADRWFITHIPDGHALPSGAWRISSAVDLITRLRDAGFDVVRD